MDAAAQKKTSAPRQESNVPLEDLKRFFHPLDPKPAGPLGNGRKDDLVRRWELERPRAPRCKASRENRPSLEKPKDIRERVV
jgi:hypothetical protein